MSYANICGSCGQNYAGDQIQCPVCREVVHWEVDYDYLDKKAIREIGPGGKYGETSFDETVPRPFKFKMFDDDGIAYYHGTSSVYGSLAPLDDYGTPNAGAVWIKYYNKETQKWEVI